ncbi:tetratricopeptide repeat protein [Thiomicrorhabdus lithotrophica]|uniref:Surface lipoprotein assembly modifier n=1 Tax=Thiomicrorhabdus lithotrophica TaxID=2949997 RepID=A0ABY8CA11_9GAMM|nr:surface lipoprotein assembly modifier [Thiomicrorhabdus lithotrophica]WEJ62764.1 surface lipoprotein assembly modifier [Thiomicrorhabdus lithotrophica]
MFTLSFPKKALFLILLFAGLTIGQNIQANDDPYIKALQLFKAKDYQASYNAFEKLVQSDFNSFNYNFYLARSATLLNNLDEAISIYERILIVDPTNTRSKLELGKLHFQQNSYALSESYFKDALKEDIPPAVARNVNQYLTKMKSTRSKSTLSAAVIFGVGHDSNINTTPESESWFVPAFGVDFDNANEVIGSNFHQETVVVDHYYDALQEYGFGIKNNLLFYAKTLSEQNDYNILFTRYTPALVFPVGKNRLEAALEYSHMHYGEESYLESYGLAPKMVFKTKPNQMVSLQGKILKKHYLQAEKQEKDATQGEISIAVKQKINSNLLINLTSKAQRERKDSGDLYDVDYDSIGIQLGINYGLSHDWKLGGSIGIKEVRYSDKNPFFFEQREDSNRRLSINLTKNINKSLAIQASLNRTFNQSNQEPYEYQKDLATLNVIKRFSEGN